MEIFSLDNKISHRRCCEMSVNILIWDVWLLLWGELWKCCCELVCVCVAVIWAGGCVNVSVRWVVSTSLSCRLNKLKFSTKRKTEWWEKKKDLSRMKTIAVTLHQHSLYWALLLTTPPLKTRTHTHCTMSNFFPKNSTHHKLQKTKSIRSLNLIFEIHYFTCKRTSTPARPDSPRHPVPWGRPYSLAF